MSMSVPSTDDVLRGRLAPGESRVGRVNEAGRVCQQGDCSTVLSIYNATGWCWQHEEPHAFVLQAPRKRRRDAKVA
jgi:hypothetical protein